MHLLRDGPNVMDRAQDIARMRARHQFRLFTQQRSQALRREPQVPGLRGGRPPFECEVADFGETEPGGYVGFVVDGRADDLGIYREGEGEGLGEVCEELGRGGTDDCLIPSAGIRVEKAGRRCWADRSRRRRRLRSRRQL